MNKFEELIKSIRFFINDNKESYTQKEVYDFLDQLRNKIVREGGAEFEQELTAIQKRASDLEAKVAAEKERIDKVTGEKTDFQKQIDDLIKEKADKEKQLEAFIKSEKLRTANDLLKGLVAQGAEQDVFSWIESSYNEIAKGFNANTTIEEKQKAIKGTVDALIETKPYLKPVITKVETDNPNIVKNTKVREDNNGEGKEDEYKSESTAIGGLVL